MPVAHLLSRGSRCCLLAFEGAVALFEHCCGPASAKKRALGMPRQRFPWLAPPLDFFGQDKDLYQVFTRMMVAQAQSYEHRLARLAGR